MHKVIQQPTLGTFRFVLAIIVFFSHIAPRPFHFLYTAVHGYIAAVIFFVVSGYLISSALEVFYFKRVCDLSHPLFLCHYTVNAVIGYQFMSLRDLPRVWLAFVASLLVAFLLYWFVDRKLIPLRDCYRGVRLEAHSFSAPDLAHKGV